MVEVGRVAAWAEYGWLRHGFSTRFGGRSKVYGDDSLNVGWTREDDPALVGENRRLLVEAVGGTGRATTLRQMHGTRVHVVREAGPGYEDEQGRALLEGDGLATNVPGVLLGIQTADCVPVMLVDVDRRAVAVLHAGWRGTAAEMVRHGVERMRREYGSRPEAMVAAVGPSIGACCYAVGEEVRAAFAARFAYADELFAGDRLDLWEANRRQLLESGLPTEHVTVLAECTGCAHTLAGERKYFSHRVDRGVTGRMMSLLEVTLHPAQPAA